MSSVDVVVPCYNYARYLPACVESVLSQRDVDVRVLIIDDKSSDNTSEIAQALAASDSRVTFRRHEINKGLIDTANEGIEWIRAPHWLLLSADDALTPGSLARATIVLDAHPEIGMVYGRAHITVNDLDTPQEPDIRVPTIKIIAGRTFIERNCQEGNPVPSPTAVVRTSTSHRVGGYCAQFPHTSDMEYWMRIATIASIAAIKEPQAFYRWHGANMASAYTKYIVNDARARLDTCTYIYKEWDGDAISDFSTWLHALKRKFARDYYWSSGELMLENRIDEANLCLDFAEECSTRHQRYFQVVKNKIKSALKNHQIALLRKARNINKAASIDTTPNWFDDNRMFGWWPGAD